MCVKDERPLFGKEVSAADSDAATGEAAEEKAARVWARLLRRREREESAGGDEARLRDLLAVGDGEADEEAEATTAPSVALEEVCDDLRGRLGDGSGARCELEHNQNKLK